MYQRLRDGHPVVAATCCAVLQFLVTLAILLAGKALLPHEQFGKVKLAAFASTLLFPIALAQLLGLWRHVGLGRPKAWLFTFAALLSCVPFLTMGLRVPPDTTIAGALTIQAINAVAEELLFRGIIFALLIRLPLGRALLINGVLFGAMHLLHGVMDGDWAAAGYQALMTIFGGLLFAAVRAETGSLWPPILVHMLLNLSEIFSNAEAIRPAGTLDLADLISRAIQFLLFGWVVLRSTRTSRPRGVAA